MMETIGSRIRKARESLNPPLSQKDFAQRVRKTPSAISLWEADKNLPRLDEIGEVAKALGVSVSFLLGEAAGQLPAQPHTEISAILESSVDKLMMANWGELNKDRLNRLLQQAGIYSENEDDSDFIRLARYAAIFNTPAHALLDPDFDPFNKSNLHSQMLSQAFDKLGSIALQDTVMVLCLQIVNLASIDSKNMRSGSNPRK